MNSFPVCKEPRNYQLLWNVLSSYTYMQGRQQSVSICWFGDSILLKPLHQFRFSQKKQRPFCAGIVYSVAPLCRRGMAVFNDLPDYQSAGLVQNCFPHTSVRLHILISCTEVSLDKFFPFHRFRCESQPKNC